MDSFIFKGKSSKDFKIIINSLPTISKPPLRVEEIEIDGVDGARYEELGYGCYEKKIKITITEDNIDSLIDWLKGEGNLILSNEPDKYYNAKIIDQIDFERLMKYEPTEIKFRVQPFKYQYQEEKLIAKTGSVEGTEIKISDVKAIQLQIAGRSTQETRSGTNKLKLVLGDNTKGLEVTIGEDNTITLNGTVTSNGSINISDAFEILANATYTLSSEYISGNCSNGAHLGYWDSVNSSYLYMGQVGGSQTKTSTADLSAKFHIYVETGYVYENYKFKIWLNEGSANLGYEAYGVAPSPDYPSEIKSLGTYNKETGKYEIEVETVGKNFFNSRYVGDFYNADMVEKNGITATMSNDGTVHLQGTATKDTYFNFYGGKDNSQSLVEYRGNNVSYDNCDGKFVFGYFKEDGTIVNKLYSGDVIPNDAYSMRPYILVGANVTIDKTYYLQLEIGTSTTDFVPYQENSSVIELNAPLRSLPNGVKDIAYIRNNKLYVDRYVGSVVLNGGTYETYGLAGEGDTTNGFSMYSTNALAILPNIKNDFYKSIIADNFKGIPRGSLKVTDMNFITSAADWIYVLNIDRKLLETEDIDGFRKWLSEHPTQVDYEFGTPVTEKLGDITILELVDGENNISNSADANMVVDYVDNKLIINNLGNYISKPTFEIEGTGTIRFMLNGNLVFTYNFDEDGRVVIDSEKEDAYLGAVLKNRNMNGEFPKLEIGENIITWDGLVKNIKAVKKSRWL